MRVLVVGDAIGPTGFGRVVSSILANLPICQYEVTQLAINYCGPQLTQPWKVLAGWNRQDPFGYSGVARAIGECDPELVFLITDLWLCGEYIQRVRSSGKHVPIVIYAPVDGEPVDPDWLQEFGAIARLVVYTEFAGRMVSAALSNGVHLAVCVIPHGVDCKTFYPGNRAEISSTRESKEFLGCIGSEDVEDSFFVLNAHRNQRRKRIDITLKGFAKFAYDKPSNVKLYLHMGVHDSGWNVLKLGKRLGIEDRIIVTESGSGLPCVPDDILNVIYNACDVGINTSTGEGWGLPNFEHAATGKAQIVPRSSACAEIWEDCAEFLEPVMDLTYEKTLVEGKIVSPEGVAAALEAMYRSPEHRDRVAQACYERVTREEYRWEVIGVQWHNLFQEVVYG